MAQTRKKRRSKHRGTAAGTIESRGRTGRKLSDKERSTSKSGSGGSRAAARMDKPPTWKSAFFRALMASVLLFVFTRVGFGPEVGIVASIALCLLALLIYVPLGYATDTFVYRRRQKRKAARS
ncbi:MAG: hypothetical protein H0V26_13720 [Solirubrobacterales bacterium]|nr:hypothetical protein [Solirubrobacterales bacterium]